MSGFSVSDFMKILSVLSVSEYKTIWTICEETGIESEELVETLEVLYCNQLVKASIRFDLLRRDPYVSYLPCFHITEKGVEYKKQFSDHERE